MFKLSIGLNDKVTKKQEITTEDAITKVYQYMQANKMGFTLINTVGGYQHDDGSGYVIENGFRLELFDVSKEEAQAVARHFIKVFHQESIAIEEVNNTVEFIA